MAIAGRVAIVPKGDWSADATYKRLDAVTHNNTLYFAKKDVPAGTETSNTEYWSKSVVGGEATVDDTISSESTNPVQNKVVKAYVDKKASENVDFSTSTSKLLNDTVEAPLVLSNATRNLLNPTLATTTKNGITCTNNGDGTYTLNGTATEQPAFFVISDVIRDKNIINKYEGSKLVGAPSGSSYESFFLFAQFNGGQSTQKVYNDYGNGIKLNNIKGCETLEFIICVMSGKTVSNLTFKPMLTTDLSATYDDFVPYSGYDIKTCGKNLLNPTLQTTTQNGVTCTNNGDGTYTFNGTATDNAFFNINKNIPINKGTEYKVVCFKDEDYAKNKIMSYVRRVDTDYNYVAGNGSFVSNTENCWLFVFIIKGVTVSNLVAKPMITTDLSATYDDFESYKDGGSVHIDSTTEFPLLGLKSFNGTTNIISPGNVEVTYAKSDSGKAILYMSENKLDKDNVVNNQTTTEAGFALDARQANPNLDGTLAKQISDLNGSLSNTFITSNINVGEYKQLCFDFSANEQIVFMWFFYPISTDSVSLYVVEHHEDSKMQLISAKDLGYNPEIVNSNGKVSISFNNNYMGYMMFSTSKLDITIY